MNKSEIENELKKIYNWSYNEEKKSLEKEYSFKSYLKTISFVNAIAWLSNNENHHPDMMVSFGKCTVYLTTHDEGGVGEKDFRLAQKIDLL